MEGLIDEKKVSEITGLALSTLRNHRSLGKGIPYIKLGKSVRYDVEDVRRFIEAHRVIPIDAPQEIEQ